MAYETVLPDFGDDWLDGEVSNYIILSLKHSTPEVSVFWSKGGLGYTHCPFNAGRFPSHEVFRHPGRYNDGLSSMAIPLTRQALCIVGLFNVVADYTMTDAFMNIRREITDLQK